MTPVRDKAAMIAGMAPTLGAGTFVFCTTRDDTVAAHCRAVAVGTFAEDEGLTAILAVDEARRLGFSTALPMRRITLMVLSALDGVGLTAAVARALADRGIPCNMVAAYHHDHVFVPAPLADAALEILRSLQAGA